MNLVSTRIITDDINRFVSFYEKVTQMKISLYTSDFAELNTKTSTLAIGSMRTLQFFGGQEVAQPAQNRSSIIEFLVDDVDHEYERLKEFLKPYLVQAPTTMPWGNRSLLFRDPDNNLVNLFTPATPEAIKKFEGKL